jgi:hypothetical protein
VSVSPRVIIRATGSWRPQDVITHTVESQRKILPEVDAIIDESWANARATLGDKLFDGPMRRMEKWSAGKQLELWLSCTSYKPFLGTNLQHAHLADRFGPEVLANGIGLSAALQTRDNFLLFGQRNNSVAYYPNRIHPFAGSLESINIFHDILRELREELSLQPHNIEDIRCIGIVEDPSLRQPEIVFHVQSGLTQAEIEARLDEKEHEAIIAVHVDRAELDRAMAGPRFTPVGAGVLQLVRDLAAPTGLNER